MRCQNGLATSSSFNNNKKAADFELVSKPKNNNVSNNKNVFDQRNK